VEPARKLSKLAGHENFVVSVAVSPDGRRVVSGGDDVALRFWDVRRGRAVRSVKPSDVPVRGGWAGAVTFSPDGKTVAASFSGGMLKLYDPNTGKLVPKANLKEGGFGAAFSSDGKRFATAGRSVRVWDVANGRLVREFTFGREIGRAWRVAFSPDGKHLAAALHCYGGRENEGPLARVWELATGKEVFATWEGGHVNAVAFSPDGKSLAIGGENEGRVEIHDWAAKKRLVRFQADKHVVFCLAFAPDGKTLYTGGNDPAVKLWEPATGKSVGKLEGHTDQVADLALSKDGRVLATAGRDKLVIVRRLNQKGR
jgi:WD40 repeat protein